ncbi:hypothetical protein SGFS_066460 [Streptomyces graminofaciens]|uniref:Uncharacterized protein n=1 Tax=Streptomyces graminofaciens TaxID=68212 RepID=A0ABM7FE69_9ACTN|nr:hypothetical protein [Streptomyces graminofaciens]BBC35352.1 hypothetical protein SGFS_066460 [Streptomyces graminofaciens]
MPELNPARARWRRWARYWEKHRRWLPLLPREPCWERPAPPAVEQLEYLDEEDIVRPYVTAYLREEWPA